MYIIDLFSVNCNYWLALLISRKVILIGTYFWQRVLLDLGILIIFFCLHPGYC